jgi:hypothetical protein
MNTTATTRRPTSKQLCYLRVLAERTGTTFTPPKTSSDASAEIGRLKRVLEARGRYEELPDAENDVPVYATAPTPEEIVGRGADPGWRVSRPNPDDSSGERSPRVLSSYEVGEERREIVGVRSAGAPVLIDRPANGKGRRYVVETDVAIDGQRAVDALVAEYIKQAKLLRAIPMTASLLRQELADRES